VYATIVIDIPDQNHNGFDYKIPESLQKSIQVGCRVLVPLGSRTTLGYVIDIHEETNISSVKAIKENLDILPSLTKEMIDLAKWMSNYYASHLFRTLQILLPASLKTKVEAYVSVSEGSEQTILLSTIEAKIFEWVKQNQPVKQSKLLSQFHNEHETIYQLIKLAKLQLKKEIKDRKTVINKNFIKATFKYDELINIIDQLPKSAKKQKLILDYIGNNLNHDIDAKQLIDKLNISLASLRTIEKKGYITIFQKEALRDPYKEREFKDKVVQLTEEQNNVLSTIVQALEYQDSTPFLLHGVTGSGKTEIYLQSIQYTLEKGQDSIILVPEISLTPQMVERFKGRFGAQVAVLHSQLSQGEKLDEWRRIQQGKAKIVVGARSAIFAPFTNLGLIIIDEEHESSYKQEEHPKYHARDIAKWRANYHSAVVVLGSATPSLESYFLATNTKEYHMLELPNRVLGRTMPLIEVVDMREELRTGNRSMFSKALLENIEQRLHRNEQIVLFLNRRGYSTFVMCRSCGYVMKCPHCDISLTYHQHNQSMRCHYCGYTDSVPSTCPECNSEYIRYFGTGTQKVEEEIVRYFPGARVIRMDVDTTSKKGAHEKLLNSFRDQHADILLGTQMIAKGLDFPKVTLVGVIAADTLLRLPDFRAGERTFQLLTQVSGRAGRHELSGNVIIQTYTPEHYSIKHASHHDYHSFYQQEVQQRRMMEYPPYKKLMMIHFSHPDLPNVMKISERFVRELKLAVTPTTDVIGPVTAPISRLKDRYRFQCMIKYSDNTSNLMKIIRQVIDIINDIFKDRQLFISVDVDPYVLM